ncbi:unnamed protein product [Cladocopium goreaui]|uniref:RBR-type E3 ubiquitin transferase n=1 Tax=Cladocopium goreaui TaxID=2562237 RepID=A0A9P1BK02_9DINO|nr:unnamed protein product [Cladocopium goreaui]
MPGWPKATHGRRKMSELSEETAEDVDFTEYMDVGPAVHDAETRCPICLEVRLDSAGGFDHTQRWIVLQCCEEAVCRKCLRQHLISNGTRCPLNSSHKLQELDIIAGCSGQEEWLQLEQRARFQENGGRGFCCSNRMCAALLPPAPWDKPFPFPCPGCHMAHCGRCGTPWPGSVMDRHVCEDLRHSESGPSEVQSRVAAERIAQPIVEALTSAITNGTDFDWVFATSQTLVAESARARLDGVGLSQLATNRLMRSFLDTRTAMPTAHAEMRLLALLHERRAQRLQGEEDEDWQRAMLYWEHERALLRRRRNSGTMQELEHMNLERQQNGSGPIKNCPKCRHPTERIDGCNIMTCSLCRADWCFICAGSRAESGCTHYHCKRAEAQRLSQSPGAQSSASSDSAPAPPAPELPHGLRGLAPNRWALRHER